MLLSSKRSLLTFKAVVVNTHGIPFWGSRCTTQFRTYLSGDWGVHWGYGILSHAVWAFLKRGVTLFELPTFFKVVQN